MPRADVAAGAPPEVLLLVARDPEGMLLSAALRRHGMRVRDPDGSAGVGEAGCILLAGFEDAAAAIASCRALRERGEDRPVVIVAPTADLRTGVALMRAGAFDVLPHDVPLEELVAAVHAAHEVSCDGADRRHAREEARARIARLTPREREVLEHVVAGSRNARIAERLGVHVQTVKVHRFRAMAKLECETPAELVHLWATAEGAPPSPPPADQPSRERSA